MHWQRFEVVLFGPDQQPAARITATPEGMLSVSNESPRLGIETERDAVAPALDRALRTLDANRERPYYDEAADRAAREAYYRDLPGQATPEARFDHLSRLVRRTHTTVLDYNAARKRLYVWVDLRENGMLRSLYTGDEYPPKKVLEEDLALEASRMARLRRWMSREAVAVASLADVEAELQRLEEQEPYNCEHVVPQSWFKPRSVPMKTDLHHLFTCDPACNSLRGNHPFGTTGLQGERCGKRQGNEFEPANGKGAAARATLYFLLRYPGEVNDRPDEYTPPDIATLLDWHHREPVDVFERHRNAAVQEAQGNRNPLIDFPDWANGIAFQLGLG